MTLAELRHGAACSAVCGCADYAEASIPEYWIVDPEHATISVLRLDADSYAEHGIFHRGETATSALLQGFAVQVDAALDAN